MRAIIVVGLLTVLAPAAAVAQTAPPPGKTAAAPSATAAPRRGGDITRDQYVERAKRNAERRFDRMDTDHDGVLTANERRAWSEAHRHRRRAAPPPK